MDFMKQSGMSEQEGMHMMIMTQYLDTLKEFAAKHSSILVPQRKAHCDVVEVEAITSEQAEAKALHVEDVEDL